MGNLFIFCWRWGWFYLLWSELLEKSYVWPNSLISNPANPLFYIGQFTPEQINNEAPHHIMSIWISAWFLISCSEKRSVARYCPTAWRKPINSTKVSATTVAIPTYSIAFPNLQSEIDSGALRNWPCIVTYHLTWVWPHYALFIH